MNTWHIAADTRGIAKEPSQADAQHPLKWAHDAQTGKPLYIHDEEVVTKNCTCVCPACKMTLTPVLAGQPLRSDPTAHFRHPPGTRKHSCTIVSARLAATDHLLHTGYIELPRRRMSRNAVGFSGNHYEVWVEVPAERCGIRAASLVDRTTAELTLDDGRILRVDLTGKGTTGAFGNKAMVTIALSDPALASLSVEEIRSRLRILPDIQWCVHWHDPDLIAQGDARALQKAQEMFDRWSLQDEADFRALLPPDIDENAAQQLRRETLLHCEAKAILERKRQIEIPGLELTVRREPPDEFAGDWNSQALRATWFTAPHRLDLKDVRLERRLGEIVPDVIASLGKPAPTMRGVTDTWVDDDFDEENEDLYSFHLPDELLIEITVTHGIDSKKMRRIQEIDWPTLEIDLSCLGGRITLGEFEDLIVNQTIGKRWVHHPILVTKRARLVELLDQHPVTANFRKRLIELQRPHWLSQPIAYWARHYLEAITAFHDANVVIRRAQRRQSTRGLKPQPLGPDSELWKNLLNATDALAVHGLDGAMDTEIINEAGVVARILSIQRNTGVGYDVTSGYQVLNAIMQSGKHNRTWDSLYAIAVKAYRLAAHFNDEQNQRYGKWRDHLIDRIRLGDEAYLRPSTYDRLLSALFPEMTQGIKQGFGCLEFNNKAEGRFE